MCLAKSLGCDVPSSHQRCTSMQEHKVLTVIVLVVRLRRHHKSTLLAVLILMPKLQMLPSTQRMGQSRHFTDGVQSILLGSVHRNPATEQCTKRWVQPYLHDVRLHEQSACICISSSAMDIQVKPRQPEMEFSGGRATPKLHLLRVHSRSSSSTMLQLIYHDHGICQMPHRQASKCL